MTRIAIWTWLGRLCQRRMISNNPRSASDNVMPGPSVTVSCDPIGGATSCFTASGLDSSRVRAPSLPPLLSPEWPAAVTYRKQNRLRRFQLPHSASTRFQPEIEPPETAGAVPAPFPAKDGRDRGGTARRRSGPNPGRPRRVERHEAASSPA